MTTSGTYTFGTDLEVADVLIEGWERCGLVPDAMTAEQARSLRRSLNLLFKDLPNTGIKLWAIDQQSAPLLIGDRDYTAPVGTVAILHAWVTVLATGADLIIPPIGRSEYAAISNKLQAGRPSQFYFDRQISPVIYTWPVPEASGLYTLNYYRFRQIQDVTASAQTLDTPDRWIEAICAGMAVRVAEKYKPERLKEKIEIAGARFQTAQHEEKQRVKSSLQPDLSGYREL